MINGAAIYLPLLGFASSWYQLPQVGQAYARYPSRFTCDSSVARLPRRCDPRLSVCVSGSSLAREASHLEVLRLRSPQLFESS